MKCTLGVHFDEMKDCAYSVISVDAVQDILVHLNIAQSHVVI